MMSHRIILAACMALPLPAAAEVADLVGTMRAICLSAEPPGLLPAPQGYVETADRETFAGPAERYWLKPDETIRMGVTFTTTARSCEFVVDAPALDPAEMQKFAALSILAIHDVAGEGVAVSYPEAIATFDWTATPASFTSPLDFHVEHSTNENQTLIRSVITAEQGAS